MPQTDTPAIPTARSPAIPPLWALALGALALWLAFEPPAAMAESPVTYEVRYGEPGSPTIEVTVRPPAPRPAPAAFVMPRAIPSGYSERPYDRFVTTLSAYDTAGEELTVRREPDGPRWQLGEESQAIARVVYEVDLRAMEREIVFASDASKVRPRYLGLLGYTVFGFIDGTETGPMRLLVKGPEGWPVFSTLAPAVPPVRETLEAAAADFYSLADSQLILGPDVRWHRSEASIPLYVALYTEGDGDAAFVGRLATEVMQPVIAYFGGAPFEHYTVHMELLEPISERHEYGFSMEHLDSGTFFLERTRALTDDSGERELLRMRSNFAHHFAHSWIPKRSHGEGYRPFTWELAPLIDTIWLNEGFAWFAATEIVSGLLPPEEGTAMRQQRFAAFRRVVDQAPRFLREMSTIELSRVASTRYGEDFRTGRNVFSRGALMAAEMDTAIRATSDGERSMRDVLRALVAWSAENRRPFRLDELPAIFSAAGGVDLRPIFDRWMKPPAELDLDGPAPPEPLP